MFNKNISKEETLLKILQEKSRNNISKNEVISKMIKDNSCNDILTKEEYFSDDEIMVKKISINGITELTDGKYIYNTDTFDIIGELKNFTIDDDNENIQD